ncbi:MAG: transcriptional regulator GcvA [Betaproteobacteria bacterium]|nr:transcriptional regulator GcvA [Betaproteobacteria bacterium]
MRSKLYEIPPLDPLLAFEAVARNLSFTKAAAELFLTQSAVSRQIQTLEGSLVVVLFERRPRALLLTESGQSLYRVAQEVLQRLHDSARKLRGVAQVRAVTLTTTPGLAALWLIPRLARFTQAHPGVDVRISAGNEIVNLERAGVDLAIRYTQSDLAGGARRLFGETVLPVCSPQLARNRTRPLAEPGDLRHHVLLQLDDPRAAWLDWQLWFHALGIEDLQPAGKLHFSHYDQLIQAAVGGQGVALGRHPLVRGLLREKKLVAPFKQDMASSRAYFLVESSRARTKPQVQAFIAWLLEETGKETLEERPKERRARR